MAPSTAFATFLLWLLFSKTVKLWPHFYRHPDQMKFIPVLVLFGYLHGLIKIYCLLTLHQVSELTRLYAPMLIQPVLDLMERRTIQAAHEASHQQFNFDAQFQPRSAGPNVSDQTSETFHPCRISWGKSTCLTRNDVTNPN